MKATDYTPRFNDTIRIVIRHDGLLRPIFWFQLGRRGDVYAGLPDNAVTSLIHGATVLKAGEREVRVNYADGESIPPPFRTKMSFHESGRIHLSRSAALGNSIHALSKPRALVQAAFGPLTTFPPIPTLRRRSGEVDLAIDYPIDSKAGLQFKLIVAPRGTAVQPLPQFTVQCSAVLWYPDLVNGTGIYLRLVLGHGKIGWPDRTLLWVVVPEPSPPSSSATAT